MRLKCKCKICGRPLSVDCDDGYDVCGDPLRLIGLLTCNPCADHRLEVVKINDAVARLCGSLRSVAVTKANKERRESIQGALFGLLKKFAALHSEDLVFPVDDVVSDVMERPTGWPDALRTLRVSIKQELARRDNQPELARTPHAD